MGKALLHARAGPDHVFAEVCKHLIQDSASAYDLLLWPKHVFPPAAAGRPPAGRRPAAGRRQPPPAPAASRRPPSAAAHRSAILFMASGQASVSTLGPEHVIYFLGPNHMDSITWIHVIGPSL